MRIKRWIVLSLAAVLTTAMLTGCPWDKEEDPGSSSSSSSSSSRPDDGGGDDGGDPDPIFYTVTASIGEGGTVTMDGTTIESGRYPVQEGAVLTFTVLPEKGWQIEGVTANGSPLTGTNGAYTYTVKGDCTIAVTFQKLTYTVTATVSGTGGMASVDSASVEYGGTANVTITPDAYYKIDSVQDNGTAISVTDPDSVFTYTIQTITENHAITVTFVSTIDPDDPSTWRVENGTLIVPQGANSTLINRSLITGSVTGIDLSQSGVTTIDDSAFYGCTSLQTVDMGSVTNIGSSAFDSCYSLQTVDMGSVTSIGGFAFYRCTSLQTVDMGSVETIGEYAFLGCASLQTVDMGSATSIGKYAFASCTNLQTVDMDSVETIGAGAFQSCTNLTNVDMGSVETIGDYAFQSCTNLTNVDMGSVETIGDYAFLGCTSLAHIRLGSVLPTAVYSGAFSGAGQAAGTITIYSDELTDDQKEDVKKWFDANITVNFRPSSEYPGAAAGNALAQYLTRLF